MRKKGKLTQPQIATLSLSIKPISMNFLQHKQKHTNQSKGKPRQLSYLQSVVD